MNQFIHPSIRQFPLVACLEVGAAIIWSAAPSSQPLPTLILVTHPNELEHVCRIISWHNITPYEARPSGTSSSSSNASESVIYHLYETNSPPIAGVSVACVTPIN